MQNIKNILYKNNFVNLIFNEISYINDKFDIDKLIIDNYSDEYDIYQFGTFQGYTLSGLFLYIKENNILFNNFIGFDSLEGLPLEKLDINNNVHWTPGQYSISDVLNKTNISVDEYKEYLFQTKKIPPEYENKTIIFKGFYEKSLNDDILKYLKPALFIDIDCDIYTSTLQVLEFIFKNKLYVNGKTIIRYDDWANNNMEYQTGQSKAHLDITKKYNINCELLLKHSYNKNPEATWWLVN
jgi:hypothetical protein